VSVVHETRKPGSYYAKVALVNGAYRVASVSSGREPEIDTI
jgi:hypothetical protein